MSTERTEEQPTPAEEVRAAATALLKQWAAYWRHAAVLAGRTVFPPRKDTQ
jgi:hypothetical protein